MADAIAQRPPAAGHVATAQHAQQAERSGSASNVAPALPYITSGGASVGATDGGGGDGGGGDGGGGSGVGGASPAPAETTRRAYATQEALELKNLTKEDFSRREYWEERFKEEPEYDWLCDYAALEPHLLEHLAGPGPAARILVIGCGNSTFSAELYDAGFHNVTNIDFAASVIARMAAENAERRPGMRWLEMDMLDMAAFADGSFDIVIGKGSLDALQAAIKDVWAPSAECRAQAHTFLRETQRVLRPDGGLFFSVSFEQPHFRTKFLAGRAGAFETDPYRTFTGYAPEYGWDLRFRDIGAAGCLSVFVYTMRMCDAPPVQAQEHVGAAGESVAMAKEEEEEAVAEQDSAPEGSRVRHDIPSTEADRIPNGFPDNSDSSW